jgi:hypothetical protein
VLGEESALYEGQVEGSFVESGWLELTMMVFSLLENTDGLMTPVVAHRCSPRRLLAQQDWG